MSIDRASLLVERLDFVDTGRRRRWSFEAKQRIVAESYEGDRQVSATARRHGISRAQVYAWRRALGKRCAEDQVAGFSQAVIVPGAVPSEAGCEAFGRMEVVTVRGDRIIVGSDFDGAALARLVALLEGRR